MSRFDQVKITFLDGATETHYGYTRVYDGVLVVLSHDGRGSTPSFPLTSIKKYEAIR